MALKIAIIGAGVNGLSCGVKIVEEFRSSASVTIFSEDFSPNTTGDGSAGLWGPYLCGTTSQEKIIQWSRATHNFFRDLYMSEDAAKAGICLIPVTRAIAESPQKLDTYWKDIVHGYSDLSPAALLKLNREYKKSFVQAVLFTSYTCETTIFLPYLMERFNRSGGQIMKMKIYSLNEFAEQTDYDFIINCAGLNAKWIVPDDTVYPIRGQIIRIEAPWLNFVFLDESDAGNYIIPNIYSTVLGGTHQLNDYSTKPNTRDTEFILSGCKSMIPSIASAKIVKEWAGLRPARVSVRLEKEILKNGKIVIHNYGHGGCGVTLSWGCAADVLSIITTKCKL